MNVLPRIERFVASHFDVTNMKTVDDGLHYIRCSAWCGSQGQQPKMWILLHHEPNHFAVSWFVPVSIAFHNIGMMNAYHNLL